MGIRYLTSSSSQVVADIQVIHSKLRLNGFLLSAGVAELTLALAFLGGWTFLNKAAVWNFQVAPALSWTFWVGAGLAFFVCGASILSGSRTAQEIFLVVHSALCADILKSGPAWESLAKDPASFTHWVPLALMNGLRASLPFLPEVFIVLSAAGVVILFFSRRHLVN